MKVIPNQVLAFVIAGFTLSTSLSAQQAVPTLPAPTLAQSTEVQAPLRKGPIRKLPTQTPAPVRRATLPRLRTDDDIKKHKGKQPWFQFRAGPRFGMVWGKIRPGLDGSSQLDVRDDLGLDSFAVGAQVDFEMQVSEKWRVNANYATAEFNERTTTSRVLTYHGAGGPETQGNPNVLPAGSGLQTDLEISTFGGNVKYAAYESRYWTLAPSFGFKVAYVDERVRIQNAGTGGSGESKESVDAISPLFGFDARFHINSNSYFGIAPAGFAFTDYAYIGGQAFWVYEFEKQRWGNLGVRLGVDADHIYINQRGGSPHYTLTEGTYLAPFVQASYGF
jgi:hypothetical protein